MKPSVFFFDIFQPCIILKLKYSQHIFTNTINFGLFHNIRDKVSQPFKTTDKTIVLYVLIFLLVDYIRKPNGCE